MENLILTVCMSILVQPIDCDLMVAIAKVESNLNPKAIGRSHKEVGLFQLHPKYHKAIYGDIVHNMQIAGQYLKWLKQKKGKCFITYYNVGPN